MIQDSTLAFSPLARQSRKLAHLRGLDIETNPAESEREGSLYIISMYGCQVRETSPPSLSQLESHAGEVKRSNIQFHSDRLGDGQVSSGVPRKGIEEMPENSLQFSQ